MVTVRHGVVSITGNFRDNNEDRALADPGGRFYLVADGMGGQAAGEKASELATEIISKALGQKLNFQNDARDTVLKAIDDAVAEANGEIMALGEVDPKYHQMGTTVVFLVRVGDRFYTGGVGDSRAYLLRGGCLERLTTDHSLTEALRDAGTITAEEAKNHRYKNVLYRYLGTKEGGTGTEAKEYEPQPGDRFLLCSDGVTDGIEENQLLKLLSEDDEPQLVARAIVEAAEQGGSRDNITCLVVFVD